jgi:DNA invertase Pin-like site-specific DNA recombinase
MVKVAFYLRVSTDGQTVENQLRELNAVAQASGWDIVQIYKDEGISGSKGRDKRPGLDTLLQDSVRRKFDLVAAWSVDRLGRSLPHLLSFLDEIHANGIDLYLHKQGLNTTTPAGRAMFQMLGVFAEFERSMIKERVHAGLARAKSSGTQLGRPPISASKRRTISHYMASNPGASYQTAATLHGVSKASVSRLVRESDNTLNHSM